MSNTFGKYFCVTTFGESHGQAIGAIIDGCPAGLKINQQQIQQELNRRRPGQSDITTPRQEQDLVNICSGIFENKTLGTPIGLFITNQNQNPHDYDHLKDLYRPSHADYTYEQRYGLRDWRGGGRSSNRESAARVAAGAIARQLNTELANIDVLAWVDQVHNIKAKVDPQAITIEAVESTVTRCPDTQAAEKIIQAITNAKKQGDSLGGMVKFRIKNCPAGLGAPIFGKLTAQMAQALISINATRSFEIGLGAESILLTGSEHNDQMQIEEEKIKFLQNNAGGVLGGMSNGDMILGAVSFKPTATIAKEQQTANRKLQNIKLSAYGRHDPCVLPRAVPIVESMLNLVIADQLLNFCTASVSRIKKALH